MATVVQDVQPRPQANPARPRRGAEPQFAHPSEKAFGALLSYYKVSWLYEPTTFPLAWDDEGRVTLAFSPDFYLPDYDLYIELATRKQGEMTLKHRKIRRLRELYPDVHLKLVNRQTFSDLLVKFGIEDRAVDLIGSVPGPADNA